MKIKDRKYVFKSCLVCDDTSLFFIEYYLFLAQDKDRISKQNWETFRNNMKMTSFKRKIDDFKTGQKFFKDW